MTRIYRIGVAMAATIGLTGVAMAVKIVPDGPSTATGATTLTYTSKTGTVSKLDCTTTLKGTVTNGIAKVTSASFTGSNIGCSRVVAQNLPWTITADTTSTGHGDGIAVNTPIGNCSATNNVPGTFNNSTNTLSFSNATLNGGCKITGSLKTSNNALKIQ